jgi:hypothetical protein
LHTCFYLGKVASWALFLRTTSHPPDLPILHCRYFDMITRAKDDPRNKKDGEMGPGGVRMVVRKDLRNPDAIKRFMREMNTPGSRMYNETFDMKVRRAAGFPGDLVGRSGTLARHLG